MHTSDRNQRSTEAHVRSNKAGQPGWTDHAGVGRRHGGGGSYIRFYAMIATSMVVMFVLMYLHSERLLEHAYFSETRLFMTMIMGGGMILVMLGYMLRMYPSRAKNLCTAAAGVALLALGVLLVRSQATVDDVDYMEGMIPHHSIAILTSTRARIVDRRVRELADGIIAAQRREIRQMQWLIDDIRQNGPARTHEQAAQRRVPRFEDEPSKDERG